MKIGITLTSSLEVGQQYIEQTRLVAESLARYGAGIVYGGTDYGMMAALADSYKNAGGADLTGVMAKDLMKVTKGYTVYDKLDNSFLVNTMEDRKRKIIELSDAVLILPGGYGTLEEIGTIIGGKANKLFDKPIAFYNFEGFYDSLLEFVSQLHDKQFSKIPLSDIALVSSDFQEILGYFDNYQQRELVDKFVD